MGYPYPSFCLCAFLGPYASGSKPEGNYLGSQGENFELVGLTYLVYLRG